MIILPAIDIKDGNCVRLFKGDFSTAEKVAADYMETAKGFEKAGASWIHMVDLDGAKDAKLVNAELIADVTAHAIPQTLTDKSKVGTYHLVASGETSWFGYASFVFEQVRAFGQALTIQNVNAIPTSAYPTPATRPHNSRLNNQKIQHTFGILLPNWQDGVKRALVELLSK